MPEPSTKLMLAAQEGDLATVKTLLASLSSTKTNQENENEKENSAGYTDAQGFSAVIWACTGGHTEIVDVLLQNGGTLNPPPRLHTPIRGAVVRGQTAMVAHLIELGVDVNVPSEGKY